MKKRYTGKEEFSQQLPLFKANGYTLSNKTLNYIRSYVYNKKDYPYFLRIVPKEDLIFLLNFIKLSKDIKNILKELKQLKQEYNLKLYSNELEFLEKNKYFLKMKELKDYRQVYNSSLYKYNYIVKSL